MCLGGGGGGWLCILIDTQSGHEYVSFSFIEKEKAEKIIQGTPII